MLRTALFFASLLSMICAKTVFASGYEPLTDPLCRDASYSTSDTMKCLRKATDELSPLLRSKESAAMTLIAKDSSSKQDALTKQMKSWNLLKHDQCEVVAIIIEGSAAEPERLRCELHFMQQQIDFLNSIVAWLK